MAVYAQIQVAQISSNSVSLDKVRPMMWPDSKATKKDSHALCSERKDNWECWREAPNVGYITMLTFSLCCAL